MMTAAHPHQSVDAAPASRNAICACGSGKRYKHCCGALAGRCPEAAGAPPPPAAMPIGATMNLALAAQKRGDLELASNLYRQVLQVEPQNIDALHMLGVIHFTRGDLDEAERLIRYADGLCPAPIPMIQHNLMMLREKIAASDCPTESVVAIHIDARDSPISRVEAVCGAQEITLPAFVPDSETVAAGGSGTGEQKALFPLIRTFVLEHAVVDAESAIPATRTSLVFDDHVDLSRHQSPEWRHGLYRRGAADNGVLRTRCVDSFTHEELATAIVLTSDYWINWAHFLTEILPKALIAERRAQWRDWPMLISSSRLANAEELLRILLKPDRRIVKAYGRMRIDEAGYVSSVGFCPLEYVYDARTEFPDMRPTDCIFSPYALDMVRAAATRLTPPTADSAPSYLYLRRNSNVRRLVNQDEVEREFSARGFKIVAPENLSVMQQIELFSRARVIAGPAGAALANLVFAPPGCQMLILAAMTRHSAFNYWLNMADAAGHHAQYVFGRGVGPSPHPAHPDMHFDDLPRLGRIIDTAIGEAGRS
jgi:capsular polysaccharide biosynthesis protein